MPHPFLDQIGRLLLSAGNKPVVCPRCENGGHNTGQTYTCSSCGFVGAPMEWFSTEQVDVLVGKAGSPPVGTELQRKEPAPGSTAFEIPASKKAVGLLIFGIIWLVVTAVISLVFLLAAMGANSGEVAPKSEGYFNIVAAIFLSISWVVGIVLLYSGILARFSKHLLLLREETLVHVREFLGKKKTTSFRFPEISSIAANVVYQENDTPVYGIEIRGAKKKLSFGSGLSNAEIGWLIAELNDLVFPPSKTSESFTEYAPAGSLSSSPFEVPLPRRKYKAADWAGVPIGLVISGVFLAVGISPLMEDDPVFRILWTTFSGVFFFGIITGVVWYLARRDIERSIVFDGSDLKLRKSRQNRTLKEEKLLPLADLIRLACYPIGSSNGEGRYGVSFITATQVIPIFRWQVKEFAQAFTRELEKCLNR